jgi:hypothetical protein
VKQMAAHAILRPNSTPLAVNRKSARPALSPVLSRPAPPHRHDDRHQRSLLMAGMILTELLYADRQMQERKSSSRMTDEDLFTRQTD